MAKTSDSIHLDLSPEDTFAAAADLSRYDDWLVLHDGWRSPLPTADELGKGTQVSSVVSVKGARVRFAWEIEKFDRPREVVLKGAGKGGVKAKINLTVAPDGDGSRITFLIDLGGLPLMGPVGKAAAAAVKGDIGTSLEKFAALFA
ncbi:toxin Rv0910/MT0934 [Gordonia spumicola]|uniref:Toxin Rv0910/MT0934 n=1 Tax=Gordonia spumicola TaxID=589161 RepID=A0A7I9V6R0_9ACTN|nr:SRPBCC family protein [Gordonia spumicola]GEE01065.1 toxin Rv0910/MT0934 [Gordonia spumicola]